MTMSLDCQMSFSLQSWSLPSTSKVMLMQILWLTILSRLWTTPRMFPSTREMGSRDPTSWPGMSLTYSSAFTIICAPWVLPI